MKTLKNMTKEELELLSYTDIAAMYLKENKTTKNTAELFKEVCNLLQLSDEEYSEQIADFFQSLTTSKDFILLESGNWDLKANHSVKVIIDDIDEETTEEEKEEDDENEDDTEPDMLDAIDDDNYITDDDTEDLSDLTIVNEEELEE